MSDSDEYDMVVVLEAGGRRARYLPVEAGDVLEVKAGQVMEFYEAGEPWLALVLGFGDAREDSDGPVAVVRFASKYEELPPLLQRQAHRRFGDGARDQQYLCDDANGCPLTLTGNVLCVREDVTLVVTDTWNKR